MATYYNIAKEASPTLYQVAVGEYVIRSANPRVVAVVGDVIAIRSAEAIPLVAAGVLTAYGGGLAGLALASTTFPI